MPTYHYKGYSAKGAAVEGNIEAENEKVAAHNLKSKGVMLREISPDSSARSIGKKSFSFSNKISSSDLSLFTRRLSTLVASAVPLFEAITSLLEQESNQEFRKIISRIRDRIAEGASLSKALSAEPEIFQESYVSMVAAGEVSGALHIVLDRLADFLEEQEQVRSRIATALTYPILMLFVGGGVMIFLLTVVIPKIVVIFEESKASLPFITVALIKISHFCRSFWWLFAALIISSIPLYRSLAQKESFRLKRDKFILNLPLAGDMIRQLLLSRFSRVLGLLLASGVPIIKGIEITSEVVVNRYFMEFLKNGTNDIAQGASLSATLKKSELFPPLLTHLVAVGEKSGALEDMLIKAGVSYEREFNTKLSRLMGIMEPVLVLGMGVGVGVVVMAVLLPIFEMNQLIK